MNIFWMRYRFFILLNVCFLFSLSTQTRPTCINNNIMPDNETTEADDSILETYLEKLEAYTGLSSTDKHETDVKCGGDTKKCTINSNGDAIWNARMTFYEKYMMNKMESEDQDVLKHSLDGCLCYSTDLDDFRNCMRNLRKTMTEGLNNSLMPEFVKLVEADNCALFACNCS